jgi:hypothetical protein
MTGGKPGKLEDLTRAPNVESTAHGVAARQTFALFLPDIVNLNQGYTYAAILACHDCRKLPRWRHGRKNA